MIGWWLLGCLLLAIWRRPGKHGCLASLVFVVVYTAVIFVALPAALIFVGAVVLATALLGGLR